MGEFKTAVEFVLGQNPNPEPTPGGWTPSQTGDIISIIAMILFALVAIASLVFFVYTNKKSGFKFGNYLTNSQNSVMAKSSKIAFVSCIVAALAICCVIAATGVTKAIAANDEADEVIKVYVDPETETLTSEPTTIVNKTDKTAYVASVKTVLSPDAEVILKDEQFNLKLESETLGTTLYDKAVPGVDDSVKSLPFAAGQQAQATLTITNLDFATAKLLTGINVFTVSFTEAECYTVTYDGNGATSGTAPVAQAKVPGVDLTIDTTSTLVKEGYTLDKWNTQADGTGDTYKTGDTYTADADLKLFAIWKENPLPPTDQYTVTFSAGTGGSVAPTSFTADNGTVYVYQAPTETFVFTNQDDATDIKKIKATADNGFRFKEWQKNESAVTQGGEVSASCEFKAVFEEEVPIQPYTITYKVLDTFDPHGSIALNSSDEDPVPSVSETVTQDHAAVGATASDLTGQPEHDYNYFFLNWTIDDVEHSSWSSSDRCLTADAIAALGLTHDTVFIAHFVAPVAKYSEENSTMIFSCDEIITGSSFCYPVYNTNWDEEFITDFDLDRLTFPAWCNYDGTQKVFPRTVKFMESFKNYKGLTSTSFWFNTTPFLRTATPLSTDDNTTDMLGELGPVSIIAQLSVLNEVSGLNNIYTENLTQTAFMFSNDNYNQIAYLESSSSNSLINYLDLSSWNINPKDESGNPKYVNMRSMFAGCSSLTNIDLPSEQDGHYFGTYAENLCGCFAYCSSLQTISLKENFAKYANDLSTMFVYCSSLKRIDINQQFGVSALKSYGLFDACSALTSIKLPASFGPQVTECYNMFSNCRNLYNIDFGKGSKFGSNITNCRYMFWYCENLRSLDLSSFAVGYTTNSEWMLANCNALEDFKISDKWSINMSDVDLTYLDSIDGWFKDDPSSVSYEPGEIPFSSGYGTFIRRCAKAVYNPNQETFTFYYDCLTHQEEIDAGCTIYPVSGTWGFSTGQFNSFDSPQDYVDVLLSNSRDTSVFDNFRGLIGASSTIVPVSRYTFATSLSNLRLPSWYQVDYRKYKIENLIKSSNNIEVKFNSSFVNCPYIKSASCWFMADSDGYAPFRFSNGFSNIPTQNLVSSACMFGGFSFEMFKSADNWNARGNLNIRIPSSNDVYVSPYLDTFNTSLENLDLSTFNILNSNNIDYGAICANCKALKTVTLPSSLCETQEENTLDENFEASGVSVGRLASFAGAFYGCENLTNITNLSMFNPFQILERRGLGFDYYAMAKMFYGCKNLTELQLANFNTRYVWDTGYTESFTCKNIFTECDKLIKIQTGSNWYISMDYEYANLPELGSYNVYWQKDGSEFNTWDIPYYTSDEPDLYGEFTRDPSAVEECKLNVNISSEDEDKGSVSTSTYTYYESNEIYINGLENTIRINDEIIIATPKPGYKFSYWTVDGWYYDYSEWVYRKNIEIVAHFSLDGYTAKAVYSKNNAKYDGDNTLTFYYDNVDHSLEGDVYDVISNTWADTDNYMALLPTWYTRKYIAEGDYGKELEPGLPSRPSTYNINDYNPYSTNKTKYSSVYYSNVWKIQTLIEPKDVIFAENFKDYRELSSISMWFMADQFGTQTVQNFYSPVNGNDKNVGFANLYTKNLNNVEYAFGGLFELNSIRNGGIARLSNQVQTNDDSASVFSKALVAMEEELWSRDSETYGTSLTSIDLTGFDFSHVPYLDLMFANCVGLKHITFDTNIAQVSSYSCRGLFANCENLGPIFSNAVTNWDKFKTDNVQYFEFMFYGCSGIEELDLSNLSTENAQTWNRGLVPALESNASWGSFGGAQFMFSECTRLHTIKIHNSYDVSKPAHISGWSLNFGVSGLSDCMPDAVWQNESDGWVEHNESSYIPYNISVFDSKDYVDEDELFNGTFRRSKVPNANKVIVKSNDESLGKVSDNGYSYMQNVQLKADNVDDSAIYLDNRKITAAANDESARLAYWQIKIDDNEEFAIPSDYCETFIARDMHTIIITAVFISNETNGYVAFSANDSREGTFTFYYGAGTDEAASAFVPDGEELVCVFDVKSNSSDYNLPSWYRKYQESWYQDDNHPVPKFVREVEDNVDNNKLYVRFDNSFAQFAELRSMSCWFMGALSHVDESVLYNPFCLDSAEHFAGLEYITTKNISNVAYMFGGHEYFNELHGSKNTKIALTNFDNDGYITNLNGLFANLPKLEDLEVNSCFNGMKNVTSTSKMFFNTPKLDKSKLTWLATESVSEMDYMFGNTIDIMPAEEDVVPSTKLILPQNFVITDKVTSMQGMFCGYANCKELLVSFQGCSKKSYTGNVANMSYMFQNCCWASKITIEGNIQLDSSNVTNMSHMYENCKKLPKISKDTTCIPEGLKKINSVTDFSYMFAGCSSLEEYSLYRQTESDYVIVSANYMFSDCPKLKTVSFDGTYVWIYSDEKNTTSYSAALNMFANSDGTLNSTLEHITFDLNTWDYDLTLYAAGLEYLDGNLPIGWINSNTLTYDTTRILPIITLKSTNSNEADYVTFDRFTKSYWFKTEYNYAYLSPKSDDSIMPVRNLNSYLYIGVPEGYSITASILPEEVKDQRHAQDLSFVIKNKDGKTATYQMYGTTNDGTSCAWYYENCVTHQTGKINSGDDFPSSDSIIWFPTIPGQKVKLQEDYVNNSNADSASNAEASVDEAVVEQAPVDIVEALSDPSADNVTFFEDVAVAALRVFALPFPFEFFTMLIALILV